MIFNITRKEVERLCKADPRFKVICPRCGNKLDKYPALSRYADVDICSDCGVAEAIESIKIKQRDGFLDWDLGRSVNKEK